MRVNIIIQTASEQFEVCLEREEIIVRNADGAVAVSTGLAELAELWDRGSTDAWTWVNARTGRPEVTDGGSDGGNPGR